MNYLRILALQTGFDCRAGGARLDYEILAGLARLGHGVRILMPSVNRYRGEIPPGLTIRYIPVRGGKFPQSLGLFFLPWVMHEIHRYRPDIIRDHSPYTFGLLSLFVQALSGIPVIAQYHHPETGAAKVLVERFFLREYAYVITDSRHSLAAMIRKCPALTQKAGFVYCGVSADFAPRRIDASVWRYRRGLPSLGPIFCASGSLVRRKNWLFLIEVMESWAKDVGCGALVIVGEGPQRKELERAICRRGLEGRVLLWNYVDQQEYIELLNVSAAYLSASFMEGFGLGVAEALACGIPAIVSDRGSLPEVVRDGITGFVLPIDKGVVPWVDAMRRLYEEQEFHFQLGESAQVDISNRFSWDYAAGETAEIYRRVVSEYMQGTRAGRS